MCSARRFADMTRRGFPHSDIHGSRLVCSSPWLFAAYHVLLRLLAPRHPPSALTSLTTKTFGRFAICCAIRRQAAAVPAHVLEYTYAGSSPPSLSRLHLAEPRPCRHGSCPACEHGLRHRCLAPSSRPSGRWFTRVYPDVRASLWTRASILRTQRISSTSRRASPCSRPARFALRSAIQLSVPRASASPWRSGPGKI